MTAQRQYILPNCNLVIEGLVAGDESDPTSPLTVVLNSECTFPGTADRLSGGREFLNALVKAVSDYAQSLLSGIPYPLDETPTATQPVTLKHTENQRHQLLATIADAEGAKSQKVIDLNSVQLFDLVEAVDQLLADALTLPDMTLQVTPLERRHARPAEPATKRVVPAAVGLSTLAAAAVLLFMVPVPEFEPQRRDSEELSEQVETESANLNDGGASVPESESEAIADTEEDGETTTSESVNEEDEESVDDSEATESDAASTDDEADAGVDPVAAGIALGRLSTAPAIASDRTLNDIEAELESKLATALEEFADDDGDLPFDQDLTYRIAVSEDADILGYKYENDAALDNIDVTPLPRFTFIPVDTDSAIDEPIAQFLLTFTPDGTVIAEPVAIEDDE